MLDLELDLEADLGVDTVKQAETFAAVREEYGIERQESLKLRDFPTLQHVVQFVYDNRPDLEPKDAPAPPAPASVTAPPIALTPAAPAPPAPPPAAPAAPAAAAPPAAASVNPVVQKVLEIVAEKTGYPPDMLEMDLDLEADLGVDTVKQAETFAAVREEYGNRAPGEPEAPRLPDAPARGAVCVRLPSGQRPKRRAGRDASGATPPPARPAPSAPASARAGVPASAPAPSPSRPTAAPSAAPSAPGSENPVVQKVLRIVADKTGYPPDMLEMDLDLEADLGVDTVKQAETFAAVREEYGIERQENLMLRDFPTLQHVVQFVYDNRPDLKPAEGAGRFARGRRGATTRTAGSSCAGAVGCGGAFGEHPLHPAPRTPSVQKVLEIVADKTGYPPDMLEMDLDLEADLGVDTVKQAETFAAVREEYGIERQENLMLRDFPTLQHVVQFVYDFRPIWRPKRRPLTRPERRPRPTFRPQRHPRRHPPLQPRQLVPPRRPSHHPSTTPSTTPTPCPAGSRSPPSARVSSCASPPVSTSSAAPASSSSMTRAASARPSARPSAARASRP